MQTQEIMAVEELRRVNDDMKQANDDLMHKLVVGHTENITTMSALLGSLADSVKVVLERVIKLEESAGGGDTNG